MFEPDHVPVMQVGAPLLQVSNDSISYCIEFYSPEAVLRFNPYLNQLLHRMGAQIRNPSLSIRAHRDWLHSPEGGESHASDPTSQCDAWAVNLFILVVLGVQLRLPLLYLLYGYDSMTMATNEVIFTFMGITMVTNSRS